VDDLIAATRELRRTVRQLAAAAAKSDERTAQIQAELHSLKETVTELRVRESRLRAIYLRDLDQAPLLLELDRLLQADLICSHVERAVEAAEVHHDPFPHLVLERVFPADFYQAVVTGIPPTEFFDGAENKQRMVVPFEMAPAFGRRVWSFLLGEVVDPALGPALLRKLRQPMAEWLRSTWPELADDSRLDSLVKMQATDGRILLRRGGYVIPPHRDPKWGFITCLLYLARPGDNEAWGTQLYAVDDDGEASSIAPHWIPSERCRLVKDVPFRANTALVFLNSHGAHGARIPASEPASLERYIYQFRLGPTADSIRGLVARLPEDRKHEWAGKVADYV
jgi:hypothetical protein